MSIETAKQKIIDALDPIEMEGIDNPKKIRTEGNLLVFEGLKVVSHVDTIYRFGFYVSKKVLNQKTETVYGLLDSVREKMKDAKLAAPGGERAELMEIEPISFENGVLEYRCGIEIQERGS